jgi:hypothetical protein
LVISLELNKTQHGKNTTYQKTNELAKDTGNTFIFQLEPQKLDRLEHSGIDGSDK